jgi:hypothetical protein
VDPKEMKKMMMEVLAEQKPGASAPDLNALLPAILDTLRQEMSRMQIAGSQGITPKESIFTGPEYIPTVSTEGMVSNVKAEERMSADGDMASSLEALKKLQRE